MRSIDVHQRFFFFLQAPGRHERSFPFTLPLLRHNQPLSISSSRWPSNRKPLSPSAGAPQAKPLDHRFPAGRPGDPLPGQLGVDARRHPPHDHLEAAQGSRGPLLLWWRRRCWWPGGIGRPWWWRLGHGVREGRDRKKVKAIHFLPFFETTFFLLERRADDGSGVLDLIALKPAHEATRNPSLHLRRCQRPSLVLEAEAEDEGGEEAAAAAAKAMQMATPRRSKRPCTLRSSRLCPRPLRTLTTRTAPCPTTTWSLLPSTAGTGCLSWTTWRRRSGRLGTN